MYRSERISLKRRDEASSHNATFLDGQITSARAFLGVLRCRAMRFLVVIDSAKNGHRTRSYLCRPPEFPKNGWAWTFQREEATEFASRKEAQQVIETTMRIKSGVLIVPVSEDPQEVAGGR